MARETINVLSRGKEGVDTKELRKLSKDLRNFKPSKEMHKALRVAGQLIADDARILIEPYSKTVGPSLKVRVSKTKISVVAGGENVPMAGLLELGNKGGGKSQAASRSGFFRHPIFGDRSKWTNQPTHPFLLPAAEKNIRKIEALEGQAVAKAFKEVDLEVS